MKYFMMIALLFPLVVFASGPVTTCRDFGSVMTCTESMTGNSIRVSRVGAVTTVNGTNSKTGHTWKQRSQIVGNVTNTRGRDNRGATWNITETRSRDAVRFTGTDILRNNISCTISRSQNNCPDFFGFYCDTTTPCGSAFQLAR